MDLKKILTVNRKPIIKERIQRLHSGVSRRYSERPLEEFEVTVSRAYDASRAVLLYLDRTHHLGKTCELLGISRPTLRHKLKIYGLTNDLNRH